MHPDYREFALAIADFAVLYDPRDRESEADLAPAPGAEHAGMARLHCEAALAAGDTDLGGIGNRCGEPDPLDPDTAPAWWAAGAPGDRPFHRARLHGNLMTDADAAGLRDHLVSYRSRAASPDGKPVSGGTLAKPVAPPARPESISVDHHDPYLVNYRNAPLPLRLATDRQDGSPNGDCAPMTMTRSGLTRTADSQVVSTLMAGTMPLCSYRYQLAGERGDAGHVLGSRDPLAGDDAPPTRDPETPQFEAYQNERILFRLVQGAQEVQHVFNIAGMAGPRNIDQRYSQGMRDLAVSVDPARRACFKELRDAHPKEYEDWLNLTPALRAELEAAGETQILARFDRFEQTLARCDNIEGYTFAQEVGISEHFEIRTRLRSDMTTIEGRPVEQATPRLDEPAGDTTEVSDYLYNFGTLDALWNGAWGLVRVYAGQPERSRILTGWQDRSAPATLVPIDKAGTAETASARPGPESPPPSDEAPGCPLPSVQHPLRETTGLVVALRTADVWGAKGTDYGAHRSDPDGLMLALLDPGDLRRPNGGARDIDNDADWHDTDTNGSQTPTLSRDSVIAAVRAAYARPEPLVMRVNAGDCVVLRYVNLLQDRQGGGLPDGLGDARMPRITPLNVDPDIGIDSRTAGTLTPNTTPITGLRPSARLGLSIGLPGGDLIRNLPLGYGINAQAMDPATGQFAQVSGRLRFYAGRMRLNLPKSDKPVLEVAKDAVNKARETLPSWASLPDEPAVRLSNGNDEVHFSILGQDFTVDVALTKAQRADLQPLVQPELHRHIHWIPYAFGPVPVRVTGDIVSQTTHGLFGVIDVLPSNWTILSPAGGKGATTRRSIAVPDGFGAPALFQNVVLDPNGGATTVNVREFVIFYQDGLNHHDSRSLIRWTVEGAPNVRVPQMTPDCRICDDSYDLGDQGVSYRSRPFASLLRFADIAGKGRIEANDDLNAVVFPNRFFAGQSTHGTGRPTEPDRQPLRLMACPGEQVLVRVVHPGGRARQRAFVMNGLGYDDLFPGFGFPNAALVAPGKTVSAWLHPPSVLGLDGLRQPVKGSVLWHDGPTFLMAGGTWGLIDFGDGPHCPAGEK